MSWAAASARLWLPELSAAHTVVAPLGPAQPSSRAARVPLNSGWEGTPGLHGGNRLDSSHEPTGQDGDTRFANGENSGKKKPKTKQKNEKQQQQTNRVWTTAVRCEIFCFKNHRRWLMGGDRYCSAISLFHAILCWHVFSFPFQYLSILEVLFAIISM